MRYLFTLALFLSSFLFLSAQYLTLPANGWNQKASVTERLGITDITIDYNRPGVKGREGKIWGTLVLYDEIWRAGANENTTISFAHDVKINGQALAAGIYGLHIIPTTGDWTIIFSHDYKAWGSFFYDASHDALRITVKPETLDYSTEWLSYDFNALSDSTTEVRLTWEYLQLSFEVEAEVHEIVLNSMRQELKTVFAFSWEPWYEAADYCFANNINLEEGYTWATTATQAEGNYYTWMLKYRYEEKSGQTELAKESLNNALEKANMSELHYYGRQLINEGKNTEALAVFEKNRKKHPEDNFTTLVGLARGHEANGNLKKAAQYFREAAPNAPAGQQQYYLDQATRLEGL